MKRVPAVFALALAIATLAFPLQAATETWKSLPLMDGHCIGKMADKADEHPRSCALQCAKGGFGIVAADGTYLKFDKAGNEQATALLKASKSVDHIRVNVTGTRKGDTIEVSSLQAAN